MREQIALAADAIAVVLVMAALWLATYRRSVAGLALGTVGIAVMAGMATLRALPEPSRLDLEQSAVQLKHELARAQSSWQATETKRQRLELRVAEVELELAAARKQAEGDIVRARAEAHIAAQRDALGRLREMASRHVTTRYFDIEVLPATELIAGQAGTYYLLRLRHEETGALLVFPLGQYRLQQHERPILQAFAKVKAQILAAIPDRDVYKLYIRGGATSEPFSGSGAGAEFGAVSYLRWGESGQYRTASDPAPFRPVVDNDDLPLLRAAYVRQLLEKDAAGTGISLLQKRPSASQAEGERSVEIILYVGSAEQ